MQRGATAIIFDITDHPEAATEVIIQEITFFTIQLFIFVWPYCTEAKY